jgi:hypothetical protein
LFVFQLVVEALGHTVRAKQNRVSLRWNNYRVHEWVGGLNCGGKKRCWKGSVLYLSCSSN